MEEVSVFLVHFSVTCIHNYTIDCLWLFVWTNVPLLHPCMLQDHVSVSAFFLHRSLSPWNLCCRLLCACKAELSWCIHEPWEWLDSHGLESRFYWKKFNMKFTQCSWLKKTKLMFSAWQSSYWISDHRNDMKSRRCCPLETHQSLTLRSGDKLKRSGFSLYRKWSFCMFVLIPDLFLT